MQNPTVRSTSSGLMMKTQKLQEGQSIKMETAKAKKELEGPPRVLGPRDSREHGKCIVGGVGNGTNRRECPWLGAGRPGVARECESTRGTVHSHERGRDQSNREENDDEGHHNQHD